MPGAEAGTRLVRCHNAWEHRDVPRGAVGHRAAVSRPAWAAGRDTLAYPILTTWPPVLHSCGLRPRVEQLAGTEVGTVAPPVNAHHVTGRVGRGTLVEPADLVLGSVERAVTTEAAALHGGQAGGPDLRRVPGDDPPDAGVSRAVEAAEQFADVQRAVRAARHAGRHRGVALRSLGHREERDDLGHAVAMDLGQGVGPRVRSRSGDRASRARRSDWSRGKTWARA